MFVKKVAGLLIVGLALAFNVQAAAPPNNGPSSYDIFLHSAGDWGGEPVAADENPWHAFFEGPETPGISPGVTYDDTPPDFSSLGNFDILYITQSEVDALDAGVMSDIRDWTSAGGYLVIGDVDDGNSEMGAFLGTAYEFSGTEDPDGDNIEVTDPTHPFINSPNLLTNVNLSDWGSSVHGAMDSVGSAYECVADSVETESPFTRLPAMCIAQFGQGFVFIMGFDPECGCHDDHLDAGTNAGSEFFENIILYSGNRIEVAPVPTLSQWALALLFGLMATVAAVRFRRQRVS